MHCRNCGSEIQPQATYCMNCGGYPQAGNRFCPNCGGETNPAAVVCVRCGVGLSRPMPPTISTSGKSRLAAGLLGIFLGGFGIHRFYLGYTTLGVVELLVTIFTCGAGILIIAGSTITTDADGNPLTD